MYGYPATGKTFIAKKLADSLQHKFSTLNVSTLDFRKKFNLFDLNSDEQRNRVYDLLAEHVKNLVTDRKHEILVIDGNFNQRQRREKLYSVLGNCPVYIIKCHVSSSEIIVKRMEDRLKNIHVHENKAATMELYNLIKNSGDDIREDELVRERIASLIEFNSEKNIIEKISLSEDNHIKEITTEISSIMMEEN